MAEEMIRNTFDAKPQSIRCENKEIGKNNRSQTENLSATAEVEVTMVPMQNQNSADFANRIESKVEVKTKNPSVTAGKETTSLSDLNPKISRCERPKDRKTNAFPSAMAEDQNEDSPATAEDQNKIPSDSSMLQTQLKANDEGLINH